MLSSTGFTQAVSCPPSQYNYRGCYTCFQLVVISTGLTFDGANQYCRSGGGGLISIPTTTDFVLLNRYLEGLEETRGVWVGYRYTESRERVDVSGAAAPSVLQDSGNFNRSSDSGGTGICIGLQNGKFFGTTCSSLMHFLCEYTYSGGEFACYQ